jgi:hypothetical protein
MQNKEKMKLNLLILILCSAWSCASQIPETNSNSNTNTKTVPNTNINSTNNGTFFNAAPNTNSTESLNFELMDSVVIQSDKTLERKEKLISDKKVKTTSSVGKVQPSTVDQKVSNQKMLISTEFTKTKMQSSTQKTQRTPTPEMQQALDEKVDDLNEIAPNSFEYHLFNYSSGNYDVNREESLNIIYNQQPGNIEVLKLTSANAIVKGDTLNAKKYLNQLEFKNVIQQETIDYTADVIKSAEGNSTLITHGFNDSYGAYQNQLNKNQQTDIDVISLDFMQSQSYRDVLTTKGYDVPVQKEVNVNYLKSFCELNADKNIAISMTLPKEYLLPLQSKLYTCGLIFEYRESLNVPGSARLEDLWYNQLNKKVLNVHQTSLSNAYAGNYLPMLLYLKSHYEQQNDLGNKKKIEMEIQKVSNKSGKSSSLKKKY